jgi:Ran GTPase-activating protein (RanGAP) involved in mRNA processing and transport
VLRFWEADIGDEGITAICQYIIETNNTKVSIFEVLNCGITAVGCEAIGRMFDQSLMTGIKVLTLDYNQFGNEGLFQLMYVIKNSVSLNYLSLSYCEIDKDGVKHFKDYLTNPLCNLNVLILTGNPLENAGANDLFQYLFNNLNLESLFIENTKWGGDEETIMNFCTLLEMNKMLFEYKIKRNYLTEKSIKFPYFRYEKHY